MNHEHNWRQMAIRFEASPERDKPIHGVAVEWFCRCGAIVQTVHRFRKPRAKNRAADATRRLLKEAGLR